MDEGVFAVNTQPSTIEMDSTSESINVTNEEENSTPGKRSSAELDVDGEKATSTSSSRKKIRRKPIPQKITNMKELLESDGVEKLNNATLMQWIKENKMHCTTRNKKEELIRKIKHYYSSENADPLSADATD